MQAAGSEDTAWELPPAASLRAQQCRPRRGRHAGWCRSTTSLMAFTRARPLAARPPRQVITGALLPDTGEVLRAKPKMRIAHLSQEFDVEPSRTLREEFLSAFGDQIRVGGRAGGRGSVLSGSRGARLPVQRLGGACCRASHLGRHCSTTSRGQHVAHAS